VAEDVSDPEIDVDSQGSIYIVYSDDTDVYLRKYVDDGSTVSSAFNPVTVTTNAPTGLLATKPKIVLDGDFDRLDYDAYIKGDNHYETIHHNKDHNYVNNGNRMVHIIFNGNTNSVASLPNGHVVYYTKFDTGGTEVVYPRIVHPPNYGQYWYYSNSPIDARFCVNSDNEIAVVFSARIQTTTVHTYHGYNWHVTGSDDHLWFFTITNNAEIMSNPTYINVDFDEDCKYGDVSYSEVDDTYNIIYLQDNNGDLDLKWVGSKQKWMPFDFSDLS